MPREEIEDLLTDDGMFLMRKTDVDGKVCYLVLLKKVFILFLAKILRFSHEQRPYKTHFVELSGFKVVVKGFAQRFFG